MVSSDSTKAPLIVIIGITGSQGSCVARALLASSKPYRLVGVTRDASKPASKVWEEKGVVIKECTIAVGNDEAVKNVFEGADAVFAMTDSWAHFDFQREVNEGKLLVDAALAAKVKLFIWSALESLSELTGGKYPGCAFYETKAEITRYLQASGQPHALVQPACYFSNLLNLYGPRLQPDGTYLIALPSAPESTMAWFDAPADYGLYVQAVLENPALGAGSEVLAGSETSFEEVAEVMSRVSGKTVKYKQVSKDEFSELFKDLGKATPMLYDMFKAFETAGFYGHKSIKESQEKAGVKARTFAEIAEQWKGPLVKA